MAIYDSVTKKLKDELHKSDDQPRPDDPRVRGGWRTSSSSVPSSLLLKGDYWEIPII